MEQEGTGTRMQKHILSSLFQKKFGGKSETCFAVSADGLELLLATFAEGTSVKKLPGCGHADTRSVQWGLILHGSRCGKRSGERVMEMCLF